MKQKVYKLLDPYSLYGNIMETYNLFNNDLSENKIKVGLNTLNLLYNGKIQNIDDPAIRSTIMSKLSKNLITPSPIDIPPELEDFMYHISLNTGIDLHLIKSFWNDIWVKNCTELASTKCHKVLNLFIGKVNNLKHNSYIWDMYINSKDTSNLLLARRVLILTATQFLNENTTDKFFYKSFQNLAIYRNYLYANIEFSEYPIRKGIRNSKHSKVSVPVAIIDSLCALDDYFIDSYSGSAGRGVDKPIIKGGSLTYNYTFSCESKATLEKYGRERRVGTEESPYTLHVKPGSDSLRIYFKEIDCDQKRQLYIGFITCHLRTVKYSNNQPIPGAVSVDRTIRFKA
mgnify:CR=1 FL=1